MVDLTDYIKNHKCLRCLHSPVCANNLGGADLDIVGADCAHFLPNCSHPILKFWVIFDVPGFYDIVEYEATEATYQRGKLVSLEGTSRGSSWATFSEKDFGKTVFFTEQEATSMLKKLMKEHHDD